MTLLKATLCFTLIFAAVVLFPLRRAQQAFAPRSGSPAVASVPRFKLRRRLSRSILAARREHSTRASELAAPVKVKAPRRRRTVSTVSHVRSALTLREAHKQSPHAGAGAPAVSRAAFNCDFAPPGRATRLPEPECVVSAFSSPPLSVTTQAVGDTPVPPPKSAL
jgi:hypothetical protein